MSRHALICVLALAATGCSKGQKQGAEPAASFEAPTVDEAAAAEQASPADRPKTVDEAVERHAAGEYDPAEPVERPRDLTEELRQALGSSADCVKDYKPAAPTTTRIRITAVVRPTGMIIEPQVTGRGLSANDLRCIEERVGAITLEPLPGSSSQMVATIVEIEYEPPAVESYDVAPPPPSPDDVVQALPKRAPIPPSGVPIEGPRGDPIKGPSGKPIEGPEPVPVEGPKPVPIRSD